MNECRITIEFLKEYYHFGTNLEMLKDALGLLPAADKTDVIHAVAEQMGNSQDLPFTDYDIDRVLGIVNGSTALVNQFARLFTSPKASTGAASNITVNGATLNGNVSPSGLETTAWFEWGPTVKMSQRTSPQLADPGVIDQIIDDFLSGLSPMSIYYYRIVAENDTGMVKGSMIRFTTSGMPPSVATSYATSIGSSSALLNGSVIPNGLSTVTRFEWGTDPSLSTQIRTPSQNAGAGTSSNTMRYSLKNLTTGTTYYFRIVASNKAGIAVGPITSFTPQGLIVSTIPASGITTNSASIGGIVNAETASVKTWFEWGPDPTLSTYSITPETTVSAGTVSHTVNHRLVGLSSMSTYYFRIAASKESGTVKGSIMSFNTPGSPPTVSTLNATSVTTSAGVLNGSVNPSGLATEAWFEWGTDPSLSSPISTPRQSAGSGTTATSIGYSLNNLANNTTYYFRIAASNSAGKARGAIRNLNTSAIVIRNETTTLKWEAPTANEDGTPLQDLAGYKIYYGNSSRAYVSSQNVGNVTQYTLYNLPAGTWFFAVTAYDNAGNESIYSNEISKTIN